MPLGNSFTRSLPPSGTAGGDLTGTFPSPTVAKVNGIAVTGTPSSGDVPTATSASAATWQAIVSGGVTSVFTRSGAVVAATNDYTFAQVSGAAAAVGGVAWTVVTKALDESVTSSSTLQADDELLFATASGAIYEVQQLTVYASPAGAGAPDIKVAFGEDATARGVISGVGINLGDTGNTNSAVRTNQADLMSFGSAAANRGITHWGTHVAAGGTFVCLWAQANIDANALTVRAGSVLRYRRIV